MDFDPNAVSGERNRSGPRWYSVVAFLTIAFLLLLNAVAMFVNAEANEKQACFAYGQAFGSSVAGAPSQHNIDVLNRILRDCVERFPDD